MAEKKFKKVVRNPKTGRKKTVRYGAKGYSASPHQLSVAIATAHVAQDK